MSCVFQNIDPPQPSPPGELLRGEDTLAGWRGGMGGQYFGRRKIQLCTLTISNPLCLGRSTPYMIAEQLITIKLKMKDPITKISEKT
jgi:hypothetical protein